MDIRESLLTSHAKHATAWTSPLNWRLANSFVPNWQIRAIDISKMCQCPLFLCSYILILRFRLLNKCLQQSKFFERVVMPTAYHNLCEFLLELFCIPPFVLPQLMAHCCYHGQHLSIPFIVILWSAFLLCRNQCIEVLAGTKPTRNQTAWSACLAEHLTPIFSSRRKKELFHSRWRR